ncbi:endonuclease I precursor [Vibrio astriarenae]|nr:endonuclease I precursor [Vibrio sp. C7]
MKLASKFLCILVSVSAASAFAIAEPPSNFRQAKIVAKNNVFYNRVNKGLGTLYCGCNWTFRGESGGVVDKESCGYETRRNEVRASRIEYEHVMPISNIGRARQCWQDGGRKHCQRVDPVFNQIEANLHNLDIAIGEVNADSSNYLFSEFTNQTASQYGQCDLHIDFKSRLAQPRAEVRGMVARIYLFMHDLYDIRPSSQQLRLLETWNRAYPVSDWEIERDWRIKGVMGYSNPYVVNSNLSYSDRPAQVIELNITSEQNHNAKIDRVKCNKRSKIYHLSNGCPSFNSVGSSNTVYFDNENEAIEAGFRKAGNCT